MLEQAKYADAIKTNDISAIKDLLANGQCSEMDRAHQFYDALINDREEIALLILDTIPSACAHSWGGKGLKVAAQKGMKSIFNALNTEDRMRRVWPDVLDAAIDADQQDTATLITSNYHSFRPMWKKPPLKKAAQKGWLTTVAAAKNKPGIREPFYETYEEAFLADQSKPAESFYDSLIKTAMVNASDEEKKRYENLLGSESKAQAAKCLPVNSFGLIRGFNIG